MIANLFTFVRWALFITIWLVGSFRIFQVIWKANASDDMKGSGSPLMKIIMWGVAMAVAVWMVSGSGASTINSVINSGAGMVDSRITKTPAQDCSGHTNPELLLACLNASA